MTQKQLPLEDELRINGNIAAYRFLSESGLQQLQILSGNWSMTMNHTAVVDFDANFTMVWSDGTGRQTFSLGNLTTVDASDMALVNDMIMIKSAVDYYSNSNTTRIHSTIMVQRLNVIAIELETIDTPIYGIIDRIVLIKEGGHW